MKIWFAFVVLCGTVTIVASFVRAHYERAHYKRITDEAWKAEMQKLDEQNRQIDQRMDQGTAEIRAEATHAAQQAVVCQNKGGTPVAGFYQSIVCVKEVIWLPEDKK